MPRTPASQSSAITKLCSASPTTKTWRIQTGRLMPGPTATSVIPRLTIAHRVREERGELARAERVEHVVEAARAQQRARARGPSRKPVDERQQRVRVDREPAVRRRHEDLPGDAAELGDEPPLPVPAAGDVLDDGVREAEVELAVGERQLAPVGADRRDGREGGGEAIELGVADGGDPLGPRVERLEEVVARAAAERRVGDADVDDGRLRAGLEEVEEEAQLPLPAPQRDASRSAVQHRTESNGAGGAAGGSARAATRRPYGPQGQPPTQPRPRRPTRRATSASWITRQRRSTSSSTSFLDESTSRAAERRAGDDAEFTFVVNPVILRMAWPRV